jgi:protein-S-isoprenylcysteine O-methyltransferase Ste14
MTANQHTTPTPPASPQGLRRIGRFLYTFRGLLPAPVLLAVILWGRPSDVSFLAGIAVAALGEAGRFWALTYIGPKSRAEGKRRADRLIAEGPYSLTRNPLYVANLAIAAGLLLAANRWVLLGFVPLGFVYYYLVALAEEEFLIGAFPGEWESFRASVPRFLPRLAWPKPAPVRFPLRECFIPELSTLIAAELGLVLIGLKLFIGFFGFGGLEFPLFP